MMREAAEDSESRTLPRAMRSRRRILVTLPPLLLTGLVIWSGADRVPSDATVPVVWYGPEEVGPQADVLTIATFNIHGGRGGDGRLNLDRTATPLDDLDFAWLQEVHGGWLGAPDQAQQLGQKLTLASAFLPTERRWWNDHFGNGLLSRRRLALVQRCPLPCTRGKAFRQAVLLEIEFQGRPVKILGVHVDRHEDRHVQLEIVTRLFLALESPAILLGDLNTPPEDPAITPLLMADDVIDPLQQVTAARGHIDWILARGLDCRKIDYVTGDASDHPAVRAEFSLPAAP